MNKSLQFLEAIWFSLGENLAGTDVNMEEKIEREKKTDF